jgi:hypothetical protein
MKLQNLNRSFSKVMAAAAIAFTIATASAQAQQGQWGTDGCLYVRNGRGQAVRQGCVFQDKAGGRLYYDYNTRIFKDLNTGFLYAVGQNGRFQVWTTTGWTDLEAAIRYMATYNARHQTTGAVNPTTQAASNAEDSEEVAPGVRKYFTKWPPSQWTPQERNWYNATGNVLVGLPMQTQKENHCMHGGDLNHSRTYDTMNGPQQEVCIIQ